MISDNMYNFIGERVIRLYSCLCKQVKENIDSNEEADEKEIMSDLNVKLDVIMDALGLEEPEKQDETESTTVQDIDVVDDVVDNNEEIDAMITDDDNISDDDNAK